MNLTAPLFSKGFLSSRTLLKHMGSYFEQKTVFGCHENVCKRGIAYFRFQNAFTKTALENVTADYI